MSIVALPVRWERVFTSPQSFVEDLGGMGEWVGPRTGPNQRTHKQKEEYTLRRLLSAWKVQGSLRYPATLTAAPAHPNGGEPDFTLSFETGTIGIEVTEAGDEDYQAWLTRTESQLSAGLVVEDTLEIDARATVRELAAAITRKNAGYDEGKYRVPAECDLLVYDNTHSGGFLDKRELVRPLKQLNDLSGRFHRVHIVFGELVLLDLFGSTSIVDVSREYEIDYAAWIEQQVATLRRHDFARLDSLNVAEEMDELRKSIGRALSSHLRVLLLHLLKMAYQPGRKSRSWILTIQNARSEIEELLSEHPSLRREIEERIAREYPRTRRAVERETRLPKDVFPSACPFTTKQVVDDDFMPGSGDHE